MRTMQVGLFTPRDIDARFDQWLTDCPDVWPLFVQLAHEVKAAGFDHYSADALCHQIRWHYTIKRRETDFKLNDHFTSRLARKLMADHPEFAGFFETRRVRAERRAS